MAKLMSEEHKAQLRACNETLASNTQLGNILSHLFQNGVLKDHEVEELRNIISNRSEYAATTRFLEILPKRSDEAFKQFCDSLRYGGQAFLAVALKGATPVYQKKTKTD